MTVATSLISMLGKPIAEKLIKGLTSRKNGAQKLEQAAGAMARGISTIEALKETFGKDFLAEFNDALGTSSKSRFSYEAGTQSYIRLSDENAEPVKVLRDELNINLDRVAVLPGPPDDLKNHFVGLMAVWQERCLQFCGSAFSDDIKSTFATINDLIKGESRNYRQIYQLLSTTSLGGVGALMVIGGVLVATGTGVGVVTAISMFLFGIPWLVVGGLVLPGALLVVLASKKTRPVDEISLSIALAYRLLERIDSSET